MNRPERPPIARPANANDIVTEDSAALEFAEQYRGLLKFDHSLQAWFTWTDTHWQRETTGLALEWARRLARELSENEKPKGRYAIQKTSFAAGVERFARGDRTFATTADCWDTDPFLLGTPGGTVDLHTGLLRSADPRDGITKLVAAIPASTPECPLWMRFLDETTGGDKALVGFLQQWAGYSLSGNTREHALFFGYGDGGNGKSVYINTHLGILGDYACVAPMDEFTVTYGSRHETGLAMLCGRRLVTATETEEGRAWAEARIKQITGGDKIAARFMRQNHFEYVPQFKLVIIGNHKPVLRNVDDAIRRRFAMVPFNKKPAVPDRELEAKLRHEWPGILRWMIDGCLDWQRRGLVRPASVVQATAEYLSEQDTLAQWLTDECDFEPGNEWKYETVAKLFDNWSAYTKSAGAVAGTKMSFTQKMLKKGCVADRKRGGRVLLGVRFVNQEHRQS